MDLSKLSDADLLALKAGDLSKVSDAGLMALKGASSSVRDATEKDMKRMADPTAGMSNFEKFSAGAGKAIVDTGRGLGQMVGLVSRDDIANSRKRDAALMDTGAGMAGNIVGNVAVNAPLAMLPGANTVTGGALIGATSGLIQPSASTNETLMNMGLGGSAGAAVPLVVNALKAGKSVIEPLYEGGRNKIVGRALREAAGGKESEVVQALRTNKSSVPGVQYTAAEAADNAGIAAMQRASGAVSPHVTVATTERQAANNAARVSALEDMAGTQGKRSFFDSSRKDAAEQLYEASYKSAPSWGRDATTGQFLTKSQQAGRKSEVTKLMNTPSMQDAWQRAQRMMADDINSGRAPEAAFDSVRAMDYTRRALSDMVSEAQGNQQRILIGLRDRLDTTLKSLSPKYIEAKNTFAEMSRPITEMDVVQEVVSKAGSKLNGNLRPESYARALSDDTARSATGMRTATLDKTVSPENLATLNAIKDDLVRQQFAQSAGRGPGSDTVQKLAYANMMNQSGLPNWVRAVGQPLGSIGQSVGKIVYGDANKEMAERLAMALLNPHETADLMVGSMVNPKLQALVDGLKRGGVAIGSSTPALVQAHQQ